MSAGSAGAHLPPGAPRTPPAAVAAATSAGGGGRDPPDAQRAPRRGRDPAGLRARALPVRRDGRLRRGARDPPRRRLRVRADSCTRSARRFRRVVGVEVSPWRVGRVRTARASGCASRSQVTSRPAAALRGHLLALPQAPHAGPDRRRPRGGARAVFSPDACDRLRAQRRFGALSFHRRAILLRRGEEHLLAFTGRQPRPGDGPRRLRPRAAALRPRLLVLRLPAGAPQLRGLPAQLPLSAAEEGAVKAGSPRAAGGARPLARRPRRGARPGGAGPEPPRPRTAQRRGAVLTACYRSAP